MITWQQNQQLRIAGLLVLSSMSLSTLVPGGPIETRSFSHINPIILGSFNTFLTLLSLLSLVLAYYVFKQQRWALVGAIACGLSYFLVYILDLGHLFPVSPDVMPTSLLSIELLGILLSLPLMLLAGQAALHNKQDFGDVPYTYINKGAIAVDWKTTGQRIILALVFAVVALGIITFATRSAMGF